METAAGLFSLLRIFVSSGVGLSLLYLINGAIWLQRPDIVDSENRVQNIPTNLIYEIYDFIVIGGGSAGAVMASRLSENTNWNILLLEAGPDESYLSEVPQIYPSLQQSELDWKFKTEYSGTSCLAMTDGQCLWPRGKVLGGSSTINAMLYARGNKKDYDQWESLGNPGWGFKDVQYYFKKLENMREPELRNNPMHGNDGPLTIEYFRTVSPLMELFLEAAKEMGLLSPNNNYNGQQQSGFARYLTKIYNFFC